MDGFAPNDPIWILNDGGGQTKATFLRAGEPAEAEIDPKLAIKRDVAWVQYEEGEQQDDVSRVFYRQINARS